MDDAKLLYQWRNDPVVRANSFHSDEIDFASHEKWLKEKLASEMSLIYIVFIGSEAVGQIRLEQQNPYTAVISYSVADTWRGRGYGTKILEQITTKLKADKAEIRELLAYVKFGNPASKRAFEKASFILEVKDEALEFTKRIR